MKTAFLFSVLFVCGNSLLAQHRGDLISHELVDRYSTEELRAIYEDFGIPEFFIPIYYGVEIHKLVYWTEHPKTGLLTPASGLITIPASGTCDFPMACYCHGTLNYSQSITGLNALANQHYFGGPFAANGYVAVIPDYLGYGASVLPHHPFLHARANAVAVIDMVRAGRHFCRKMGVRLNGQLFLTGYSEGGFVAMATHREMEQYYPDEFVITASAPSGGAYNQYDISRDSMLFSHKYSCAYYLSFIAVAYEYIYEDIYETLSDMFLSPYDGWIAQVFNRAHPQVCLLDSFPALGADMLQPWYKEMLISEPDFPTNQAIRENDVYDWAPKAPVHLYYCSSDEMVPPVHSIFTAQYMNDLGATQVEAINVSSSCSHLDCAYPALLGAKLWFDSFREPCLDTLPPATVAFNWAPNPFHDFLTLTSNTFLEEPLQLRVYDITGREIACPPTVLPGQIRLDFAAMPAGLYVFELKWNGEAEVFVLMKG